MEKYYQLRTRVMIFADKLLGDSVMIKPLSWFSCSTMQWNYFDSLSNYTRSWYSA